MEMEQVTVSELATEFDLRNSVVISELKKIGVWVPSPDTQVDTDIANRIRKRLQLMAEAEQEEKEKKAETVRKTPAGKVRRTIKQLGKPRKKTARAEQAPTTEEKTQQSPLATSLKPRKGRKSTLRKEAEKKEVPEEPLKNEVTIEDEPVIERVEARLPAELVEEGLQAVPGEDQKTAEKTEEKTTPEADQAAPARQQQVVEEKGAAEGAKVSGRAAAPPQAPPPETKKVRETPKPPTRRPAPPAVTPKKARAPQPAETRPAAQEKVREVARARQKAAPGAPPSEATFSEKVTVKTLAEKLQLRSNEILKILLQRGIMANINQVLDEETVRTVCQSFGVTPSFVSFEEAAAQEEVVEDVAEDLVTRAPVVTIMGHVDHGKTTLLDFIRKTRVAAGEAGGITQHIGAYQVETKGHRIVFIDTPGHEAFTRMRARGAQATDIVILVVAADDGVKPQTVEAINHARAAEVPIIVAINKIDKPEAQVQRVKQQLAEHQLVSEDWGGDTVVVEVSAVDGTNVDLLLEMILLVADLEDLKANPRRGAQGVVLEAKLERGRGAVATLLIQNGSLRVGDNFIAGAAFGKIRAMFDDRGKQVKEAGPSSAVEILGLQGMPQAGDAFQVVEDAGKAREIVEFRQEKLRDQELAGSSRVSLDELYAQMKVGEAKELALVLKADTQGSVEVLEDTLQKLSTEKVKINIIHKGVGAVSESDVLLASASSAIVIGFNVRPEASAASVAEKEDVEIRLYTVIYDIASEIQQAMTGLLEPTIREKYLGRAEVRETFRVPRAGVIAGSYVQDGIITRNAEVRLLRDKVVIWEGKVSSLRRFKEDVAEVRSGYECGIGLANFNDIKVEDEIEAFQKEEVAAQLN